MGDQRRLFDDDDEDLAPIVEVDLPANGTHAEHAAAFHAGNPQVYRACVRIARRVAASGLDHYGIGAVWEILRFSALETTGAVYKLNNNYRAWYARQIMLREPDLEGFFQLRHTPHDSNYYASGGAAV